MVENNSTILPEVIPPAQVAGLSTAAPDEWPKSPAPDDMDFDIFSAFMQGKIQAAMLREGNEKLLRAIHLRQVKRRLEPQGKWGAWLTSVGLTRRQGDYPIESLGEWADSLLLKLVNYAGIQLNDIPQLANCDLHTLEISADRTTVNVDGKDIPCTPWEIQDVIDKKAQAERVQKTKHEKEVSDLAKEAKKDKRELARIKRRAEKEGMSPEEVGVIEDMEEVRKLFDGLMSRIDCVRLHTDGEFTPRMVAAVATTIDYMKHQLTAAPEV